MTKLNKYISESYQNFFDNDLSVTDPELFKSIKLELERQQQHIELIASENIVSKAVLDAQGSIMTNKYAEGYPSKRYYGGGDFVDKAEDLALERVKQLFDCKYANVMAIGARLTKKNVALKCVSTFIKTNFKGGRHLRRVKKI